MKVWFSVLLAGLGAAVSLAAFFVSRDWKVLALCSLITILVLEQIRLIYQRTAEVEQLVRQRTQELSKTNAQIEEDRRRITAHYAVTRVLSEAESLRDAAPRVLQVICETLEWKTGTIWSVDRAANILRCEEFRSLARGNTEAFEQATRRATFARGLGLPGRVWDGQEAVWVPEVINDDNFPRAGEAQQAGLHAAFAFPIRLGKEILGIAEFFNDQIRRPDDQLIGMMTAVGSQIGQFIERKHLEKLKDEFVSTVSHEMRTPLSIAKEGISLVLDRVPGEINPEQDEILKTARANVDRLARIINDLLDISKLEAGRVHLRRERVEVGGLFRQVAEAFKPMAAAKGLVLRLSVPEQEVPVYADADKMMEILTNLTDNAIKFTDAGQITLSARTHGGKVECSVEDTGVGISAEDLPHVFGKFEQFGRLSGAGARGTGLGLAIVKRLVELHGGTIRVESQLKKGARFIFTVPPYSPRDVLENLAEDKVHEATAKGAKLSLLWITAASVDSPDLGELGHLIKRKLCRREDQMIQMPGGLALLAADCDRDAAAKVQARCERLLRAALVRKGGTAGGQLRCARVTFPDEAQTAKELLAKLEERCRRLEGPGGNVIPIRASSQRMAG